MHYLFEDILYEFYYYSEEVWGMFMFMSFAKFVLILVLALIFWGKLKEERDGRIHFLSLKIAEVNSRK